MGCWCGYPSGARCRLFTYGPADASVSQNLVNRHLLPRLNPDWIYLSGTGLPRLSWKRPLNRCSSSTHTHTFNGSLSRTTRVSRYQKGKTSLDFTEARDSEWQWHQLGHMQVCTSLHTDNHTSTPPLSFLQAGCPSCRPTNSVKALKGKRWSSGSSSKSWNDIVRLLSYLS